MLTGSVSLVKATEGETVWGPAYPAYQGKNPLIKEVLFISGEFHSCVRNMGEYARFVKMLEAEQGELSEELKKEINTQFQIEKCMQ